MIFTRRRRHPPALAQLRTPPRAQPCHAPTPASGTTVAARLTPALSVHSRGHTALPLGRTLASARGQLMCPPYRHARLLVSLPSLLPLCCCSPLLAASLPPPSPPRLALRRDARCGQTRSWQGTAGKPCGLWLRRGRLTQKSQGTPSSSRRR